MRHLFFCYFVYFLSFKVSGCFVRKKKKVRGCLVPFLLKNFGFWFIILYNKTKYHANFLTKGGNSLFWILAMRIINCAF